MPFETGMYLTVCLPAPCGLSLVPVKNKELRQVALTLRPSVVLDGTDKWLGWKSARLGKGLKVKGVVTAVKEFGVFIQLDDSEVRLGLTLSITYFV